MNEYDQLKKSLEYLHPRWVITSDKTRGEVAKELALKYKSIKDEQWKQKAWTLLCKYQQILGRVVNHLH